ncbi:phosphoribosyl pyrophosphokinase [Gonapodya prolifera JEL478]|uniref:ribose-phosphate diphosphokinase n=1 Tax=Gonapodya prolifera (strain JEL478) TaxID=1344416 RepID=A0A139A786_GONPJ|nr:phosphoribosyl pyrophosphokinase [Gonapodya prolifera JEL478]|eukprot:KXS12518.1 phosphoribosyl pyrophosphokinase [Gonapodya prolifera JEL478]
MRNINVFSGSSHPALARSICQRLNMPLAEANLSKFANRETSVEIKVSVRQCDVYIVQSACGNVNDMLVELLIMIHACKIASARRIVAVIPCFPYARQPETPYKRNGMPLSRVPIEEMDKFATVFGGPSASAESSSSGGRQRNSPFPTSTANGVPETPANGRLDTPTLERLRDGTVSPTFSTPSTSTQGSAADIVPLESPAESSSAISSSSATPTPSSVRAVGKALPNGSLASNRHPANISVPHPLTHSLGNPVSNAAAVQGLMSGSLHVPGVTGGGYKHWAAKSGKLIADLLGVAGADHIITVDLHDPHFQGFFGVPVDNLSVEPVMVRYIKEHFPDWKKAVIVSPDAGGAKRASKIADRLGIDFALIHKERRQFAGAPAVVDKHGEGSHTTTTVPVSPSPIASPIASPLATPLPSPGSASTVAAASDMLLVGSVAGRTCILIDDIADTSFTITKAARTLVSAGATKVCAIVTHGIMSGDAVQRIKKSVVDELIVSNTVPQEEHRKLLGDKLKVFDVGAVLAEAIRRIHNGESISLLYNNLWALETHE